MKSYAHNKERGATMVEFALMFPFFMLLLLFAWWLGLSFNAKNSLGSAVELAPRQSFARGQTDKMNSEILPAVHTFLRTNTVTPTLRTLLASSPTEELEAFGVGGAGGWYRTRWEATLGPGVVYSQIPPQYAYALVYAYQAMKKSVGPGLRFPCDPMAPNGENCMRCVNLNATTNSTAASNAGTPRLGSADYDTNYVGIECEYRGDSILLTPLVRLMAMFGGSNIAPLFVVRRSSHYKLDSGTFDPALRSII